MNILTRDQVYAIVSDERDYQDSLASTSETNGQHSIAEFILYMEDYIADARTAASKTWGPMANTVCLDIIRKVTALGVACMEQNGAVDRVWEGSR